MEGHFPRTVLTLGSDWTGTYLGQTDWRPGLGPWVLNQEPLIQRKQMVFHGFDEEVLTGVVILDQSFFFNCLEVITTGDPKSRAQPH